MVYFWISIFLHFLGRIQDFTEGGLILGPPKVVPCRGVRGTWCFEVSFLLHSSLNLLINILQFLWRQRFQFRGFDRTPWTPPLYPPRLLTYFLNNDNNGLRFHCRSWYKPEKKQYKLSIYATFHMTCPMFWLDYLDSLAISSGQSKTKYTCKIFTNKEIWCCCV